MHRHKFNKIQFFYEDIDYITPPPSSTISTTEEISPELVVIYEPILHGFCPTAIKLRENQIQNYNEFIHRTISVARGRSVCLPIFDVEDDGIIETAHRLSKLDSCIFVNIPVIKPDTKSNMKVIKRLHRRGVSINVTGIYTKTQIDSIKNCFGKDVPTIVNISCDRIRDLGYDCKPVIAHAVNTWKHMKNIKILWGGCQTLYDIIVAKQSGAHIISIPKLILTQLSAMATDGANKDYSLTEASKQEVIQTIHHATMGNIFLN
jgi:transaldolase